MLKTSLTKVSSYIKWQSEYGKDIEFLQRMDEDNRGINPNWKTPKALLDMPELMPWETPYVSAFYTLTSSRQSGMGLGAIPYSEMTNYCSFWDIDDPELFIYIMQKCDNIYLAEYNKKQEAKNPKKGK